MAQSPDLQSVFEQLKALLAPYAQQLVVTDDTSTNYMINTPYLETFKKAMFFAGVSIKKKTVSLHLMPVYVYPDLLDNISPKLKQRMQGKSCFNFTSLEPVLAEELARLTASGYEAFNPAGAPEGTPF